MCRLLTSDPYTDRIGMSLTTARIVFKRNSMSDSKKYRWLILESGSISATDA